MKLLPTRQPWLLALAAIAVAYLMLAYVLLPVLWTHHEHEPGLASLPMVTRTSAGIPGDALNVGLVGVKEDVLRAMHEAGWFPADPITLRTSIEIVGSVVLDRPYHDAPVSPARSGPWRPGFPVEGDHRFRWMTTTCSGRWRPGQQGCGRA